MTHDPFLTMTIEAIGRERVVIACQHAAAHAHKMARHEINNPHSLFRIENTIIFQQNAAWYSRNARALMGIEP